MNEANVSALWGALAGATLSAPLRGRAAFRSLRFYEPIPTRIAPHDVLDVWLAWAEHFSSGRSPEDLCDTWRFHLRLNGPESAYGTRNLALGFRAPLSGGLSNPLPLGAEALARSALWGVLADDSANAAIWASYDAALDHADEGVALSMAVAAAISMARPGLTPLDIVAGVAPCWNRCPQTNLLVSLVQREVTAGGDPSTILPKIDSAMPSRDPFDVRRAFACLVLALLAGAGEFDRTVRIAAGCGGASDAATIPAAMIVAKLAGGVPAEWTEVLGTAYISGGALTAMDVPITLKDWVTKIAGASAAEEPEPQVFELAGGQLRLDDEGKQDTPTEVIAATPAWAPTFLDSRELHFRVSSIGVACRFVSPPIQNGERGIEAELTFRNLGASQVSIDPKLTISEGWRLATKLTSARVDPGQSVKFAFVVAGPKEPLSPTLQLHLDQVTMNFPILVAETWFGAGPFANVGEEGYDKVYRCEDVFNMEEVFSGRSQMGVRWQPVLWAPGPFDTESALVHSEGVYYLAARIRFAHAGTVRVVAAGSPGVVVSVDRQRLVRYQQEHVPIPRLSVPYVGEFQAEGTHLIMIKLIRNRQPAAPFTLSFFSDTGEVVRPSEFLPLEG